MKVLFVDEYGENIPFKLNDFKFLPAAGDCVIIEDIEWFVQSRTFNTYSNFVTVELAESMGRKESPASTRDERVTEMKTQLQAITQRQNKQESKGRILREQLVSLRSFLKNQKPKE